MLTDNITHGSIYCDLNCNWCMFYDRIGGSGRSWRRPWRRWRRPWETPGTLSHLCWSCWTSGRPRTSSWSCCSPCLRWGGGVIYIWPKLLTHSWLCHRPYVRGGEPWTRWRKLWTTLGILPLVLAMMDLGKTKNISLVFRHETMTEPRKTSAAAHLPLHAILCSLPFIGPPE